MTQQQQHSLYLLHDPILKYFFFVLWKTEVLFDICPLHLLLYFRDDVSIIISAFGFLPELEANGDVFPNITSALIHHSRLNPLGRLGFPIRVQRGDRGTPLHLFLRASFTFRALRSGSLKLYMYDVSHDV